MPWLGIAAYSERTKPESWIVSKSAMPAGFGVR